MIEADAETLAKFERDAMQRLIYRCAELHLNHIATSGDPFEFGSARPARFWTLGGAQAWNNFPNLRIRHGEAVAIGIALDVIYSRKIGLLNADASERILVLLETLGYDLFVNELLNVDTDHHLLVLKGLEEFREHLGGELTITLLKEIGEGVEVHAMNLPKVIESIYELQERHNGKARSILQARV